MGRSLSRFERAWRERAHRAPLTSPAVVDPASPPLPRAAVAVVDAPDGALRAQVETVALVGEPAAPIDLGVVDTAPLAIEFKGSSNLRVARLDAATSIVEVEFKGGKLFRYANFTPELMTTWRDATSAGSWFDANVKKQPDRHPLVPAPAPAPTPKPEQ